MAERRVGLNTFSPRAHPHLYEINTYVWLEELSAQLGRQVLLRDVPDKEWDRLADLGFDFVYLMGVWKRSLVGRRSFRMDAKSFPGFDAALPGWATEDVAGSPYSIQDYSPDPRIGTIKDLSTVRGRLRSRGMGLILDFVPNHTGFDHEWISEFPDRYIQGTEADFHRDPSAFYLVEREDAPNLYIARGKDPYFTPWADVAQLNYFNPECRKAMIRILKDISRVCDGVRCDMAMLVTNEVFTRTWGRFVSAWPAPATEFWQEAIPEVPGLTWLAEVYWDMEWRMQQLGFSFAYDKRLYDRLKDSTPSDVRSHLGADIGYQSKLARFLENHDEPRSASVFSRSKLPAAAILLSTLPGMRFYHHGQFDGRKIFVPMPLGRARQEAPDQAVRAMYDQLLRLADADVFHTGEWKLLDVQSAGDDTSTDLIAYRWQLGDDTRVIVVNLGDRIAQGKVQQAQGGSSEDCVYRDLLNDNRYVWKRAEIGRDGLYVRLAPYGAHAFVVTGQ